MDDDEDDDDYWWEMVFSAAMEEIAFQKVCNQKDCLTFACQCRKDAIARVTRNTGVNFATNEL